MFKTRPCGCKGIRSCKICETNYGAWEIDKNISKDNSYIYCPLCKKLWKGWEINAYKDHPNHSGNSRSFSGVEIYPDFITAEEEDELMRQIDRVPWDPSQSGRYKQNYGPKCNFKRRKVSLGAFRGYPAATKFVQDRFASLPLLAAFETAEQCALDYAPERGSCIDPHVDDCWIWGERIPTLNLLSDAALTLTRPSAASAARYNLGLVEAPARPPGPGAREPDGAVVRLPLPRRALVVLFGEARYEWEHAVLREDVLERRVCLTYRELAPPFRGSGPQARVGAEILERARVFFGEEA